MREVTSAAVGNTKAQGRVPVLPISIGGQGHHGQASNASSSSASPGGTLGTAFGGAIYVAGGSVTLFDQDISHNLANYGGAIYEKAGTVTASGLKMTGNAAESGGAIYNAHGAALTIRTGLLMGNKAANHVDGYTFASSSSVAVKGSNAGAIYNRGHLDLAGVTVSKNSGKSGGGILNHSGTIAAATLDLTGNKAVSRGGGIYSLKGSLTIVGGTIENNSVSATGTSPSVAIGSGGGLDLVSAKVSISGVTVMDNAARAGGGIYISSGSATLTDNTFENNLARQDGGTSTATAPSRSIKAPSRTTRRGSTAAASTTSAPCRSAMSCFPATPLTRAAAPSRTSRI